MIIAMPNNQVVHRSDPRHTELTFPLFEKELRQEIVPPVDKTYIPRRIRMAARSPVSRWVDCTRNSSGSRRSISSPHSAFSALGYSESEKTTPEFLNDRAINNKVDYLFVGLGTHENAPTNRSVMFHSILEKHGIAHDYYVGGDGGNDWGTWRAHLVYMLPKLWRAKGAGSPRAAGRQEGCREPLRCTAGQS